jgi:hypothetical protein
MPFTSSSPKPKGHFLLPAFLLIPFNFHSPASNYNIPLLSFLSFTILNMIFYLVYNRSNERNGKSYCHITYTLKEHFTHGSILPAVVLLN